MATEGDLETRESILAVAQFDGFCPSDVQLKAWRRAGLLPGPVKQVGQGQGRGSITYYPAGTAQQLVALGRLHRHERQLGPLAFQLWWHGYPVSQLAVRRALAAVIDWYEALMQELMPQGELTDAGWDVLDRIEVERRLPPSLIQARKRVGRGSMSTATRLLLLVASGAFGGWGETPPGDRSDSEIMASAVGIGILSGLLYSFGLRVALSDDPETVLSALSARVHPDEIRHELADTDDTGLKTARTMFLPVVSVISDLLRLSELTPQLLRQLEQVPKELTNPLNVMGLKAIAAFTSQLAPDWRSLRARDQMLLFLAGLALSKDSDVRKGLAAFAAHETPLRATRLEADAYFGIEGASEQKRTSHV